MPRIHQNQDKYAAEDFRREIRSKQGYFDLMSQQALADAAGIPRPTLRKRLLEPEGMLIEELRKLIATLHPDIATVLPLLGYSAQEIKKFRNAPKNVQEEQN